MRLERRSRNVRCYLHTKGMYEDELNVKKIYSD